MTHFRNRLQKNITWSFFAEALGRFSSLLAQIVLARRLKAESYGVFILAQVIVIYFWHAIDLGTNMYGIREIAGSKRKQRQELVNLILSLRITMGILISIIYFGSLIFVPILEGKTVYLSAGLYLISYSLYSDWIFKGIEKFEYVLYGNMISSIIFLLFSFFLVNRPEDLTLSLTGWSISYFFSSLVLLLILKYKFNFKFKFLFDHLKMYLLIKQSIYFTISGVLDMAIRYLPILFLGFFSTNYYLGIFSAPYKIITTIANVGIMIPMAFYPIFSSYYRNNNHKDFEKLFKIFTFFMVSVGLSISLFFFVLADKFVLIFFGQNYAESILVLKIISFSIFVVFVRYLFGIPILSMNAQRIRSFASFLALILGIFIALLLKDNLLNLSNISYYFLFLELLLFIFIGIFYLNILNKWKKQIQFAVIKF